MKRDSLCNIEIWCPSVEMSALWVCPRVDISTTGHQICMLHSLLYVISIIYHCYTINF